MRAVRLLERERKIGRPRDRGNTEQFVNLRYVIHVYIKIMFSGRRPPLSELALRERTCGLANSKIFLACFQIEK